MGELVFYLRSRAREIGFFLLSCAVFALTFALYRLPIQAVLYPAGLVGLCGLTLGVRDYLALRRRHREIETLLTLPAALCEPLPEPKNPIERDDLALIGHLREECASTATKSAAAMDERMRYFTVWAHQIKTPIASMDLQLQNEDSPRARELRNDLGRISQYADMALAYLRLDSPADDLVLRETCLDSVIRSSVRRFAGEFILRGIRLDYAGTDRTALTDEKWLGFALEQVLSNALKYTKSGTISIAVEDPLTIVVRDTGIGIAPEDLPRIFENGYTGQNGREYRQATGIGLWLTKRVCDRLGHRITAASEVGVGTEVRIGLNREKLEVE